MGCHLSITTFKNKITVPGSCKLGGMKMVRYLVLLCGLLVVVSAATSTHVRTCCNARHRKCAIMLYINFVLQQQRHDFVVKTFYDSSVSM